MAENLYIPEISGPLRSFMLKVPEEIQQASGIRVMGKLIKSIVFTTDICISGLSVYAAADNHTGNYECR